MHPSQLAAQEGNGKLAQEQDAGGGSGPVGKVRKGLGAASCRVTHCAKSSTRELSWQGLALCRKEAARAMSEGPRSCGSVLSRPQSKK